jgi:outer membrane protein assembly factor BamB
MNNERAEASSPRKPLRLWPGVAAVVVQFLVRFAVPLVVPGALIISVLGGLAGGLVVLLWWIFLSRAPWSERLGAVAVMIAALWATPRFLHESIAKGAQGMLFVLLVVPALSLAFVVWAAACRRLPAAPRRAAMVAAIVLACGGWTLFRTGGVTGDFNSDLRWRWAKTPEERLLSQSGKLPAAPAAPAAPVPVAATGADWPGFRGPGRDGIVHGARIETDWSRRPPVRLWRRPVGPGWSSFAVRGDLFYTQEQRGPDEVVACYRLATGEPVWTHSDKARFWESNGGPGPRATPTLGNGRVYTLGATGILNALNASDGAVVWSRNAASDTTTKVPGWGFAGSPLLFEDLVIVAAAGQLAAYDLATGTPRWFGPRDGGGGYSSPQLSTIGGMAQVLLLSDTGVTSVAPSDGGVLWKNAWPGFSSLQPALTPDGGVLIATASAAGGIGTRRLSVAHAPGGWRVEERWTSTGLKPYFNDFVVHRGHAFGFDGSILACIDLQDGRRVWKGGRFGYGQLILLPEQDLLLVLSEQGELALVKAAPGEFTEVARFPAIEGKTWNHPVLAGDVLLARNSEEMAAFRLSPERR